MRRQSPRILDFSPYRGSYGQRLDASGPKSRHPIRSEREISIPNTAQGNFEDFCLPMDPAESHTPTRGIELRLEGGCGSGTISPTAREDTVADLNWNEVRRVDALKSVDFKAKAG